MGIIGPKETITNANASGIWSLKQQQKNTDVWPSHYSILNLWRIYINTKSSYGLWDIDNGYFQNSAGQDMVSGYSIDTSDNLQQGKYGIFEYGDLNNPFTDTVKTTGFNAGPDNFFNGARSAWNDQVGHYIAIWFNTPIRKIQMSGANISLRTFTGSRANRCPVNMSLQYYNGLPAIAGVSYNASLWTTYATLTNTAQSLGTPRFLNITEGSTIVAS